jgi:hypothetical protein
VGNSREKTSGCQQVAVSHSDHHRLSPNTVGALSPWASKDVKCQSPNVKSITNIKCPTGTHPVASRSRCQCRPRAQTQWVSLPPLCRRRLSLPPFAKGGKGEFEAPRALHEKPAERPGLPLHYQCPDYAPLQTCPPPADLSASGGADHPASSHPIATGSRSHSVPPHRAYTKRRTARSAVVAGG